MCNTWFDLDATKTRLKRQKKKRKREREKKVCIIQIVNKLKKYKINFDIRLKILKIKKEIKLYVQ